MIQSLNVFALIFATVSLSIEIIQTGSFTYVAELYSEMYCTHDKFILCTSLGLNI